MASKSSNSSRSKSSVVTSSNARKKTSSNGKILGGLLGQLDSYGRNMDARTNNLISGINTDYSGLYSDQQANNKAYEAGTETEGLVSGRARYAAPIQSGIEANAANVGVAALNDITAKKNRAILEAKTAQDDKQYSLLNQKIGIVQQAQQEERIVKQNLVETKLQERRYKKEDANKRRDDSRAVISNVISTYGGIEWDELEPQAQTYLSSIAQEAGYPVDLIKSNMRTIKQQNLDLSIQKRNDTNAQRDVTNALRSAALAVTQANAGPKVKTLDLQNAIKMGLPTSLVGASEETVANELTKTNAPSWFVQSIGGNPNQSTTQYDGDWNKFKQRVTNPREL